MRYELTEKNQIEIKKTGLTLPVNSNFIELDMIERFLESKIVFAINLNRNSKQQFLVKCLKTNEIALGETAVSAIINLITDKTVEIYKLYDKTLYVTYS